MTRWGVLLVNLGTPDSPSVADVRRYLHEFLSDPLVVDIPAVARAALLHLVILRRRPKFSAAAYRSIWTERGSPLLVHGLDLTRELRQRLDIPVELGMRYGKPSIAAAIDTLLEAGTDAVCIVPLFPQHSVSARHSAVAAVLRVLSARNNMPACHVLPAFYDDPRFIDASVAIAREALTDFGADHVLVSFHGLPERHVRRADESGAHCLEKADCCDTIVDRNRFCYRAQCVHTARAIARGLDLGDGGWDFAFQSRLGRSVWIGPATDQRIVALAETGVKRLAVLCPSFVADCLETIEEIGMRGREAFEAAGGTELRLVPCVNADTRWADALAAMIRASALGGAGA